MQAKPTAVASTASVIRLAPNASAAFAADLPVESLGRRRHLSSKSCPASDVYLLLCMNHGWLRVAELISSVLLVETLRAAHHNCQPTRRIMVYMAIMHSQWLREWERLGLLQWHNTKIVCFYQGSRGSGIAGPGSSCDQITAIVSIVFREVYHYFRLSGGMQ